MAPDLMRVICPPPNTIVPPEKEGEPKAKLRQKPLLGCGHVEKLTTQLGTPALGSTRLLSDEPGPLADDWSAQRS